MLVSLSIHPAFPLPRLFTAVVRPAGGTDKTGGRVPLGLNHAPANGADYRIFHGIRYLRCVVRAVRAVAGQPLLYVPPASVLRIYRHVSDTKRLRSNRSFSDNHSRLFLSAPPSSNTPTAQAVVAVRSRPDAENRSHMLRIFPRLSAGCSRGAVGHTSREVSEQYRVASATRRSCAGRLSAVGGRRRPKKAKQTPCVRPEPWGCGGLVPLGTLADCGEYVCISGRSLARFS